VKRKHTAHEANRFPSGQYRVFMRREEAEAAPRAAAFQPIICVAGVTNDLGPKYTVCRFLAIVHPVHHDQNATIEQAVCEISLIVSA